MINKVRAVRSLDLSRKDEVKAFLSIFYPNLKDEEISKILRGVE